MDLRSETARLFPTLLRQQPHTPSVLSSHLASLKPCFQVVSALETYEEHLCVLPLKRLSLSKRPIEVLRRPGQDQLATRYPITGQREQV